MHAATAAPPAGGQVKVMLMTGDVVLLSTAPDGKQTASVIKARKTGPGAQFQMFTEGKDVYVVPQSAVPYLGSTLSPSLFDVTQLAQQEQGSNQSALDTRFGALAWQTILFGSDFQLSTPLQRTEYYTALPGLWWEGVYYSYFNSSSFELIGEFDGSWVSYQPGQTSSTVWGGQPAHPRLRAGTATSTTTPSAVCCR